MLHRLYSYGDLYTLHVKNCLNKKSAGKMQSDAKNNYVGSYEPKTWPQADTCINLQEC